MAFRRPPLLQRGGVAGKTNIVFPRLHAAAAAAAVAALLCRYRPPPPPPLPPIPFSTGYHLASRCRRRRSKTPLSNNASPSKLARGRGPGFGAVAFAVLSLSTAGIIVSETSVSPPRRMRDDNFCLLLVSLAAPCSNITFLHSAGCSKRAVRKRARPYQRVAPRRATAYPVSTCSRMEEEGIEERRRRRRRPLRLRRRRMDEKLRQIGRACRRPSRRRRRRYCWQL